MPKGKRWTLAEETSLAKAFLAATQNPFHGTDQTADAFQKDMIEKFKGFSPELPEVLFAPFNGNQLKTCNCCNNG
jgi:hypothetical protein